MEGCQTRRTRNKIGLRTRWELGTVSFQLFRSDKDGSAYDCVLRYISRLTHRNASYGSQRPEKVP